MQKNLPHICPSCSGILKVKSLVCDKCHTEVSGIFGLPLLASLTQQEQEFIIDFVKCSGSLKIMAQNLKLSYPTVRNLLDDIIRKIETTEKNLKTWRKMKKWLFNPFVYVAGTRSLLIGWAVMLLTAIISQRYLVHFDGVVDVHAGRVTPAWLYYLEPLIDWGCAVLTFYFAGKIFSRSSIRLIDVAGTLALARWVLLLAATILAFSARPSVPQNATLQDIKNAIGPGVIIQGLLVLVIVCWLVALMYNAFTVSCNLKGNKTAPVFIGAIVLAEILSKVALFLISKNIY